MRHRKSPAQGRDDATPACRRPFVIATFVCFALFPVAVVSATGFATLVLAFVVGGLREIGEPSRKAMIVDFAEPHLRARTVGGRAWAARSAALRGWWGPHPLHLTRVYSLALLLPPVAAF